MGDLSLDDSLCRSIHSDSRAMVAIQLPVPVNIIRWIPRGLLKNAAPLFPLPRRAAILPEMRSRIQGIQRRQAREVHRGSKYSGNQVGSPFEEPVAPLC